MKSQMYSAVFMIMLVLSLPFYSASVLASINVVKNQGDAALPGFIDAEGDNWLVEASINKQVEAENVLLKIGEATQPFQTCSGSEGNSVCTYLSPLPDGINEGEYVFQVVVNSDEGVDESKPEVIKADGSAPSIEFTALDIKQLEDGSVEIDFLVTDNKVGLQLIEIIDSEGGMVLQTINELSGLELGVNSFVYAEDSGFGKQLQAILSGEGFKSIKIKAADVLGHESYSKTVQFKVDYASPIIKTDTFDLDIGDFIGKQPVVTSLKVEVEEKSDSLEMSAVSDQIKFKNNKAECSLIENDLFECVWQEVEIQPVDSLSISLEGVDAFNNVGVATISKSFVKDESAPLVNFFGTSKVYDGKSYAGGNENQVLLLFSEQGAGIETDNIVANLADIGGDGYQKPNYCFEADAGYGCVWDTKGGAFGSVKRISLRKLVDLAGNEAGTEEIDVFVDNIAPVLNKVEVLGFGGGEVRPFFQSQDALQINLVVEEVAGLMVLVDVNDVVNDAATEYPEGIFNEAGWAVFDESSCQRNEAGLWECVLITKPMKSGFAANSEVQVIVMDTAGNPALDWPDEINGVDKKSSLKNIGRYSFDLLGVSSEQQPDYWEDGGAVLLQDFVDIDAMNFPTRLPVKARIRSENAQLKAMIVEMVGCSPVGDGPGILRSIVYGGISIEGDSDPQPKFIMEFEPVQDPRTLLKTDEKGFDGIELDYTCQFRIFSRNSQEALPAAEIQDISVKVPFAFSELGSIDENVAQKVKKMQSTDFMKFAKGLSYVNIALEWIKYIANTLTILQSVFSLIDLFGDGMGATADNAEKSGLLSATGAALRGSCMTMQEGEATGYEFMDEIQGVVQILNCNPNIQGENVGGAVGNSWYGQWQKSVLQVYNVASGRDLLGVPASTLYENLYLSAIGLCVPGVIFNINKAREVHCRQVVCYARDVTSGVATFDACDKLYDLQMCEYFWGPVFDFVGLGGLATIGKMLQSAFTSPVGLIGLAETLGCSLLCFVPESKGALSLCKVVTALNIVLDIVESIIGMIDNRPDVNSSPYCGQMEKIKMSELTGSGGKVDPSEGKSSGDNTNPPPVTEEAPQGQSAEGVEQI
jgi:hypothetical protein